MKVQGLDGKPYSWYLVGYQPKLSDERPRSELHISVRNLLKELCPSDPLLEEVFLPGSGGLYLDFLLPKRKTAVEAHGIQHYKYNHHFHGNIGGFIASRKRDETKRLWCQLNNITLVELAYNENVGTWKDKIRSAT